MKKTLYLVRIRFKPLPNARFMDMNIWDRATSFNERKRLEKEQPDAYGRLAYYGVARYMLGEIKYVYSEFNGRMDEPPLDDIMVFVTNETK